MLLLGRRPLFRNYFDCCVENLQGRHQLNQFFMTCFNAQLSLCSASVVLFEIMFYECLIQLLIIFRPTEKKSSAPFLYLTLDIPQAPLFKVGISVIVNVVKTAQSFDLS